jgi:hypothetical protein
LPKFDSLEVGLDSASVERFGSDVGTEMTLNGDEIIRGVRTVLGQSGSPESKSQELVSYLGSALLWEWATLWVVLHARRKMRAASVWHSPSLDATQIVETTIKWDPSIGEGMVGRAWRSQSTLVSVDVVGDMALPRSILVRQSGLRTGLWVPIPGKQGVGGVLEFLRTSSIPPDADHIATIERIAYAAAPLLDESRLPT